MKEKDACFIKRASFFMVIIQYNIPIFFVALELYMTRTK